MENNMEQKDVSYLAFESSQARMERINKRLWIVIIILIVGLVGSNAWWIHYESQFQDVVTVTQDTPNGNNSYVGRDGSIVNGTTDNNQD